MKKLFYLIISIAIGGLLILLPYLIGVEVGKRTTHALFIHQQQEKRERIIHLLTDWVYTNSEKISRGTAEQIVKECLNTDRALLLLALIKTESEFVPSVVSSKGAIGLTQVMFVHHGKALIDKGIIKDKKDLFDISLSVKAGNFVLSSMLKENKDDLIKTLNSYLGGHNETYLKRILTTLGTLFLLTEAEYKS